MNKRTENTWKITNTSLASVRYITSYTFYEFSFNFIKTFFQKFELFPCLVLSSLDSVQTGDFIFSLFERK